MAQPTHTPETNWIKQTTKNDTHLTKLITNHYQHQIDHISRDTTPKTTNPINIRLGKNHPYPSHAYWINIHPNHLTITTSNITLTTINHNDPQLLQKLQHHIKPYTPTNYATQIATQIATHCTQP